jgi:hypothetical protein
MPDPTQHSHNCFDCGHPVSQHSGQRKATGCSVFSCDCKRWFEIIPSQHSLPEVPDAAAEALAERCYERFCRLKMPERFAGEHESTKNRWRNFARFCLTDSDLLPSLHAAWEKEEPEREGEWTIRVCECGCVHDFPDASCPQCESKISTPVEVISANSPAVLSKEEARLLASTSTQHPSRRAEIAALRQRLSDWAEGGNDAR